MSPIGSLTPDACSDHCAVPDSVTFWVITFGSVTMLATRYSRLFRTMSVTISVVSTSRSKGAAEFFGALGRQSPARGHTPRRGTTSSSRSTRRGCSPSSGPALDSGRSNRLLSYSQYWASSSATRTGGATISCRYPPDAGLELHAHGREQRIVFDLTNEWHLTFSRSLRG